MSLDAAALARALEAQHDHLLRETLMTLCADVQTVVAVVDSAFGVRQRAGASLDALAPLADVRREVREALRHLERAVAAMPPS